MTRPEDPNFEKVALLAWFPERIPLVCTGIIAFMAAVKVINGDWFDLIGYMPLLGILLLYRTAEKMAFESGWSSACMRMEALLDEQDVPPLIRLPVTAVAIKTAPTLSQYRRAYRMMLKEITDIESPTPEDISRIVRKYR